MISLRISHWRLLLAALWLLPCFTRAESPAQILKIGAIYGLTGPLAGYGEECRNAALLAAEAIGREKQIKLEIFFEDSGWDPKRAVDAFHKLVNVNHVTAVHVMGSGPSMAIKPLARRKGILLYSQAAHPQLVEGSNQVLRHSNNAALDARVLAEAVSTTAARRLGILYVQNEWAESYKTHFISSLKEKLPQATVIDEGYSPGESDYHSQVLKLTSANPDVIVLDTFGPSAGVIVKRLRESGYRGKIYANNGFVLSPEPLEQVKEMKIRNFFYQSYPAVPDAFQTVYRERYGKPADYLAVAAYTDYEITAEAALRVGADGAAMAEQVRKKRSHTGRFETCTISPSGEIDVPTEVRELRF